MRAAKQVCAALAAALACDAAAAQQRDGDAQDQIRRALSDLCVAETSSLGDGSCSVRFIDGALVFDREIRRIRRADEQDRTMRVELTMRAEFDDRSHFFCDRPRSDGRAPLLLICSFDDVLRGPACISETRTEIANGRAPSSSTRATPLGPLAYAAPERCAELAQMLNGLLDGPRAGADPYARDPG